MGLFISGSFVTLGWYPLYIMKNKKTRKEELKRRGEMERVNKGSKGGQGALGHALYILKTRYDL